MKFLLVASLAESLLNFRGPLIAALQARGFEVHVVAPDLFDGHPTRLELEGSNVRVHTLDMARAGMNPFRDVVTCWSLYRLMVRIRPLFVLGYTIKPVIYGLLAARLSRVPKKYALITGLGFAFQGDGRRGKLQGMVESLYRLALVNADTVFFQNADDELLFRQRHILKGCVVSCVVNGSGVDTAKFGVVPFLSGPLQFLLVARLLGDKGVREYVLSARRVKRRFPEVRFQLAGWIDENPDSISQSEVDGWVDEGVLEYLGRLADVRPAMADCSVYVLPSYREGTPRTVLEAMAMGRPIITTDAPGCRETVVEGENGFLVPVKSVDALEEAMVRFIQAPDLTGRMGARSRQIAEEKYDVHKVNAAMLAGMGIE